jgi:hypothetical protein
MWFVGNLLPFKKTKHTCSVTHVVEVTNRHFFTQGAVWTVYKMFLFEIIHCKFLQSLIVIVRQTKNPLSAYWKSKENLLCNFLLQIKHFLVYFNVNIKTVLWQKKKAIIIPKIINNAFIWKLFQCWLTWLNCDLMYLGSLSCNLQNQGKCYFFSNLWKVS